MRSRIGLIGVIAVMSIGIVPAPATYASALSPLDPTDWSQRGFDPMHRSFNPFETILDPSNVSGLQAVWRIGTGGDQTSPIVADGTVFTISYDNASLSAIDADTGTPMWRFGEGHDLWLSPPAVAGGRVYVADDSARLSALDEATGSPIWSLPTHSGGSTSPVFVDDRPGGTIYVGLGDALLAVDAVTGTELWRVQPAPIFALGATPAVADGLVYQPDARGTLHAYDTDDGHEVWTTPLLLNERPLGGATVDQGLVLVAGTLHGDLYAVDALTGTVRWRQWINANSTASVANGVVYVYERRDTNRPIFIAALAEETGTLLWRGELGSGNLYGFPDGPAIANGVVYAGSLAAQLFAFDARTGAVLWEYPTGAAVLGTPAVVDGRVYATAVNELYSFGLGG